MCSNHLQDRKMGYRRISKRNTTYYDDDSDLSDQDMGTHSGPVSQAQYARPSAKSTVWGWARASTGARNDRNGALKQLSAMPLDILFEIFGHLHPHDILRLARTTHRLRQLLMSRSAVSVWKSAFSHVEGLPGCPSDLTEPQYANLAFEEHCHFCFAPGVKEVFWTCRVRCCGKCINKYFAPEFYLDQLVPYQTRPSHRHEFIFPYIVHPKPTAHSPGRLLFYLPAAESYIQELTTIKEYGCASVNAQWMMAKRCEQNHRLTHAALCERWRAHWVYSRSEDRNIFIVICLAIVLVILWSDKLFPW